MDVREIIGKCFEEFFHSKFPDMIDCTQNKNTPDFYHPSGFWVEAKGGIKNGAVELKKIKFYHLENLVNQLFMP